MTRRWSKSSTLSRRDLDVDHRREVIAQITEEYRESKARHRRIARDIAENVLSWEPEGVIIEDIQDRHTHVFASFEEDRVAIKQQSALLKRLYAQHLLILVTCAYKDMLHRLKHRRSGEILSCTLPRSPAPRKLPKFALRKSRAPGTNGSSVDAERASA